MSSMIPMPPSQVQVNGPSGDPSGGGAPPSGGGDPIARFKAALDKMSQDAMAALQTAHDPIDKQAVTDILSKVHALQAAHQKEEDALMGGGPGAKMIRRSTPPGGTSGGGGGL